MELFKLFGSIFVDNEKANESIHKTEEKAEGLSKKLLNGVGAAAKWGAGLVAAGTTAAGTLGGLALNAAKDFESQMANVATLLDGDVNSKIEKLGDNVKKMASDTGTSTELLTDGLYQVISAFGETEDAMSILETASKGALAGNATVTDSVNLLSAVTKGYGDTSSEAAQKASDLAFLAVKLGQTSFPELASSMGKVIPLASTLKVSQEELFGAMATLTGVTGGTAEVSTQLRATLQGLMKPSKEMTQALKKMGYENGAVALESLGLQGVLTGLKESVGGNEIAFSNLFSSVEAGTAALALTGSQAENFIEKTKAMQEASGATEAAFKKQTETVGAMFDKLKTNFNVVLIELGEKFLPALNVVFKYLIDEMPQIKEIISQVFTFVGNVITIAVDIIKTYLIPMFSFLIDYVKENFPYISKTVGDTFNAIREFLELFIAFTKPLWETLWWFFSNHVETTFNIMKAIILTAIEIIQNIFKMFSSALKGDWQSMWEALKSILKAAWDLMMQLLWELLSLLVTTILGIKDRLYDAGVSIFNALWDGIKSVWTGISNWVNEKVDWLVSKVKFWDQKKEEIEKGKNGMGGGYGESPEERPRKNPRRRPRPHPDGSHAGGLSYVPFNGYIAELHKGERVLTAKENKEYSKKSGDIVNNFNIAKLIVREEADIKKVARELHQMEKAERRSRGDVYAFN